jgi:hypothetical protein
VLFARGIEETTEHVASARAEYRQISREWHSWLEFACISVHWQLYLIRWEQQHTICRAVDAAAAASSQLRNQKGQLDQTRSLI